ARSAFGLLSYPEVSVAAARRHWPQLDGVETAILEQLQIDAQYAVYVEGQREDVEAVRRDEKREFPAWLDLGRVPGLSVECRQKLQQARPATIAQAQAIDGMTPAAITLLLS